MGTTLVGTTGDKIEPLRLILNQPRSVFIDTSANLYISDNTRIRFIALTQPEFVVTIAGTSEPGH